MGFVSELVMDLNRHLPWCIVHSVDQQPLSALASQREPDDNAHTQLTNYP